MGVSVRFQPGFVGQVLVILSYCESEIQTFRMDACRTKERNSPSIHLSPKTGQRLTLRICSRGTMNTRVMSSSVDLKMVSFQGCKEVLCASACSCWNIVCIRSIWACVSQHMYNTQRSSQVFWNVVDNAGSVCNGAHVLPLTKHLSSSAWLLFSNLASRANSKQLWTANSIRNVAICVKSTAARTSTGWNSLQLIVNTDGSEGGRLELKEQLQGSPLLTTTHFAILVRRKMAEETESVRFNRIAFGKLCRVFGASF